MRSRKEKREGRAGGWHDMPRRSFPLPVWAVGLLLFLLVLALWHPTVEMPGRIMLAAPEGLSAAPWWSPVSTTPILTWDEDYAYKSVAYEVEFFTSRPSHLTDTEASPEAVYTTTSVYQNAYNPDLKDIVPGAREGHPLYWRVRALDIYRVPITPFSQLQELYVDPSMKRVSSPLPTPANESEPGGVMLYPVYSWVPMAGAKRYEVAVYDEDPVRHPSAAPIETLTTRMGEIYDPSPHYGNAPFYWRVRGLDAAGAPVGTWSPTQVFKTSPETHWEVAVFGDSISHGGGHISYGPAVLAFSWLHYLDFPAINLSESGDTVEMSVERFERDVLPFHPKYLLIMTGSNSLRAGEDADYVVGKIETIRQKCLANGIRPILLTLPAMNPTNIAIAFQEETVDDWAQRVDRVNQYIRTQVHIDTALAILTERGRMPTEYALDGLHPDANGKELIGQYVNEHWREAKRAADALRLPGR